MRWAGQALAVCCLLAVLPACRDRARRKAPGRSARADASLSAARPRPVAEPWRPLKPRAPAVGEFFAGDPALPDLRQLGLPASAPPAPRPPARWLRPRLLRMMQAWKAEDHTAAQAAAGRLVDDPKVRLRDLTSLGMLACVDCSLLAVRALQKRVAAQDWRWSAARWLLPLAGHASERVRAAVVSGFAWARAHLPADRARKRTETFLRVFRYLGADPSPWVRAEAVTLLGRLKDRTAHRLLVASTKDRFPVVRMAAVAAIAEAIKLVSGAPSTKAVCALLDDPSPAVRAAVLRILPRTQAPCSVARVVALLQDRFIATARLATDESGSRSPRGQPEEVRQAAFAALPPAFRAGAAAQKGWDDRVGRALDNLRRLQPRLAPGPAGDLRPMQPLSARLPKPDGGPGSALTQLYDTVLRGTMVDMRRQLLRTQRSQQDLARRLSYLGRSSLLRLLEGCDVTLRGPLLAAVVGLLAHARADVRRAALKRLATSTVSDRRVAVASRALWLARRDPHPLVRGQALALLVAWHRGAAVQARLRRSLDDPHPAVRHRAVTLVLQVRPRAAGRLLRSRLAREVPALQALLLSHFVRTPALRPRPEVAARFLDDRRSDEIRVRLGSDTETVGGGFGSVRGAVLSALERSFGRRHRGTQEQRAKRWQDDLLRLGWKLARPLR